MYRAEKSKVILKDGTLKYTASELDQMLPPQHWEYTKSPWYFGLVIKVFRRDPQLALHVADVITDVTNVPISRAQMKRQKQQAALTSSSSTKNNQNETPMSSASSSSASAHRHAFADATEDEVRERNQKSLNNEKIIQAKMMASKAQAENINIAKRLAKMEELEKGMHLLQQMRDVIGERLYSEEVRSLLTAFPAFDSFDKCVDIIDVDDDDNNGWGSGRKRKSPLFTDDCSTPHVFLRPRIQDDQHYRFSQLPVLATPIDVIPMSDNDHFWTLHNTQTVLTLLPSEPPTPPSTSFEAYVRTLHPWEAELLNNIRILPNSETLSGHLTEGFRVVSDGSVKETHGNGSFGWVLSSSRGTRLVYGKGPARGRALYSYRAEAYGMLSVLRFLIRYREFTATQLEWQGILATDAQSVIDTLRGKDRDPQAPDAPIDLDFGRVVLDVLCPEWDILIEIQAAFKLLPQVRLQYVKSHQDREKAYDKLELLGQLNVDADEQAKSFGIHHGESRPFVIMTPLTRAHLVLPDGTVTGKYATVLQKEATDRPLQEYIQKKNNWSPFTMNQINWEAHGLSMKRKRHHRTHLVKMVHEMLPTTGLANKFDKGNRQCPRCLTLTEDRDHILRCPHHTRAEWRLQFIQKVEDHLKQKDTAPALQSLLITAISQWFLSASDIQVDPNLYCEDVRQVIRQQNAIGWRQLFHGRYAIEWSRVQDQYLSTKYPHRKNSQQTGVQWQVNLILYVWDKWYTLWKQRNQELHGQDVHTRAEATRQECRQRLEMIYSQRTMYEVEVQELLLEDEQQHYQQPLGVLQNWLATNEPIFRESARRLQQRIRQGVQSILPFLVPRDQNE